MNAHKVWVLCLILYSTKHYWLLDIIKCYLEKSKFCQSWIFFIFELYDSFYAIYILFYFYTGFNLENKMSMVIFKPITFWWFKFKYKFWPIFSLYLYGKCKLDKLVVVVLFIVCALYVVSIQYCLKKSTNQWVVKLIRCPNQTAPTWSIDQSHMELINLTTISNPTTTID